MSLVPAIDGLRRIPNAIVDDAAAAPRPPWWRSNRISEVRGGIQIAGSGQDIQTPGSNFREFGPATVSGSWMGNESPLELDPTMPEGWATAGIETLAWYSSYHYAPWAWGIFIRSFGVERVAAHLVQGGTDEDSAFRLAFDFLLAHELTHYRVDLLITGAELAAQQSIFVQGRRSQHARSPGYGLAEEGLANALALRSIPSNLRPLLETWMASAPPGYRDFRVHGNGRRQRSWHDAVGDVSVSGPLPLFWTPVGRPPWMTEVPVFIVQDTPMPGLASAILGSVPIVGETATFQRDLKRLMKGEGRLSAQWMACREKLAGGQVASGTHLERIDRKQQRYSVKVNVSERAGLQRTSAGWYAIAIDRHDELYRRISLVPPPP